MNTENLIQRFQTLYELFPDFICTLDLKGTIIDCNDKALNFFGYKKEEAIGKSCLEFIKPEYRDRTLQSLEVVKKDGIGKGTELMFIRRDGTTFLGLARGVRITDISNQLTGFLVSIKDATPLHDSIVDGLKRETIIREKLEEVLKVQESKNALITGLKNEALNDLTPLSAYVDILLADHLGPLLPEQRQRLEESKFCIQQLTLHLSMLSDVTKNNFAMRETNEIYAPENEAMKVNPFNANRLRIYANLENKTTDKLIDDLIDNYFAWNTKTSNPEFIQFPRFVTTKIFSRLTDEEIIEIAVSFAKEKLKLIIEAAYEDSKINRFLAFLKKRSDTSGFEYLAYNEDGVLKISIIHRMGLKCSLFFMTLWNQVLHDMGYPANSKYSEDSIIIDIPIQKDSHD